MPRTRLDLALVERGLVETRAKGQALIMAGRILVNGRRDVKPGMPVREDDELEVVALEHPWVGRGGMKLAAALESFGISVEGRICLDVGASTGGFTDVMLQGGATRVYAVDVGHGQLDASLRSDPRVVVREKVNARHLEPSAFEDPIDFVSIDVSFISLELILPPIHSILREGGELVALIKPQFEVGKGEVGKGGIVRDARLRAEAVERIVDFARATGYEILGLMESPVRGAEGNVESLMYGRKAAVGS